MKDQQINYCPQCGKPITTAFRAGRQRPVCAFCDWVYFPDPKVAVVMLVRSNQQILLGRRGNTPQQGLWTLPGGFVDAGEDPARAAERECLEETGLVVETIQLLDVIAGREHPRGADMLIVYHGEIIAGELNPGDDVDLVGYFDLNQLPELAFKSTHFILSRYG